MSINCPAGTFAYTIRTGDTYFSLAARFNTTVSAITAANPGVNPNALQVGQVICIPGVVPPTTCPAGTLVIRLKPGTLSLRLAQRFNTTVAAIVAANPGIDPNAYASARSSVSLAKYRRRPPVLLAPLVIRLKPGTPSLLWPKGLTPLWRDRCR